MSSSERAPRRALSLRLGAVLVALAPACGTDPPRVVLALSSTREVAPARVRLDASGSSASEGGALSARFDADGDGSFETPFSAALAIEHDYAAPGVVLAKVEVREEGGGTATAVAELELVANTAPSAQLSATPSSGKAPLSVVVDASSSTDPDQPAESLEVAFDLDGDGEPDGPPSTARTRALLLREPGRFTVGVVVRDSKGATDHAEVEIEVLPAADLDADSDRSGTIDLADDEGEDFYAGDLGAVFLANLDDDDGDGRRDSGDAILNGAADLADLAPLVVRRYPGLEPGRDRATITADGSARDQLRVFLEEDDGHVRELLGPGGTEPAELPVDRLAAGDLRLFIEAIYGRDLGWGGLTRLTLVIEHAGEVEEDVVELRAAPILFPDNTLAPERLFVMKITDVELGENGPFVRALEGGLPEGVALYLVDEYEYWGDRWVQDSMQTGYQVMPVEGGEHLMRVHLETQRPTGIEGLEYLLTRELLGADLAFAYPGGRDSSLNYGGNLEVSPPVVVRGVDHPFGRLVIGGGDEGLLRGNEYSDHMAARQREHLLAQESQGPLIEVSTEWLAVGHLDEIIQFVPDTRATAKRPWKVVIASPALARRALEELSRTGRGDLPVFEGRLTETTVAQILADPGLASFNDAAQARIDTVREDLMAALDLAEEDFVEVPVLYEPLDFGGGFELAAAYNPGVQNLVTLGSRVFVPDPEGPRDGDTDVWRASTLAALEPLGLDVVFVDVFDSYHLNLGEAHCGTEVERARYSRPWWEIE